MSMKDQLINAIPEALTETDLTGFGDKITGKVRDIYKASADQRILIATDRISAFDCVLGAIPYRGQVLNQLSLWWFEQLSDVVANHVIASPDENVTIVKEAQALPVEVIVRGYITGVTDTSMWTMYERGERAPYGIILPDGLQKNDPLSKPVITPTTKAEDGGHDERITPLEIMERGLIRPDIWAQIERVAIAIFERGQAIARSAGLVLVDTKYEFGLIDGKLALIDEVHTPDSSRYWLDGVVDENGEPAHYDKEYLRKWFVSQGYRGEGVPPTMPDEFIADVAGRYIDIYERLTGQTFQLGDLPIGARIAQNLTQWFHE
jgi:phosphoribosylaminoimidazole-succinocarboxamide synthase